jgi:glycosyltransferase involved in cell wall biosynthesis
MANRVTVAIPVFNGMPHLQTALESVLQQTHEDLDVVVIDNASTDGTAEYVESVKDDRLRLIRNPTNIGLEGNWNKAWEEAGSSPYWKMVCADDLLYPQAIATEVAALEGDDGSVMTAAQRAIIDDDGATVIKARGLGRMSGRVSGVVAVRRSVRSGTNQMGEPPSVLVRSSALKEAGPFDGTHQFCIDFDMWARVLQLGDLHAIRTPLAAFRVGVLSNSLALARKQRTQVVGEFKKLVADPRFGLSKVDLWRGIVAATLITEARMAFYRFVGARDRLRKRGNKIDEK